MKDRALGEVQKQLRQGGSSQPLAVCPRGQKPASDWETAERERGREQPDRWDKGTRLSDHLHGKHVPGFLQEKAGRLRYRQTSFHCTALYCASLYCIFFLQQIKGLWQPSASVIFPTVIAHLMSLSHFGHSHNILSSFIIFILVMMTCDQWFFILLITKRLLWLFEVSDILAWRIPGTGEPGGLPSMGSHRVGHDWSDLAAAANYNQLFLAIKYF